MGAERPRLVAALQAALLRAAAEFADDERVAPHRNRALSTAAALDYVLMLVSGTAGVRIPRRDAERATRDGIARGVDDLIVVASAVAEIGTPAALAFARESASSLRAILHEEALESDSRSFAVIALSNP